MTMRLKDLHDLLAVLRAHGVTHYRARGLELHLADAQPQFEAPEPERELTPEEKEKERLALESWSAE